MKTFFNFLIFLIFLIFRPASQPAWLVESKIRVYGTKFAYEDVFQFLYSFDFFDFQTRQTSSLASQPAWLVEGKIRVYGTKFACECARLGYMVPNMHVEGADSGIWYQICT